MLRCPVCGREFSIQKVQTYCTDCNSPILAEYNLPHVKKHLDRDEVANRPAGIWRWAELLPVFSPDFRFTLGEGATPLIQIMHPGLSIQPRALYVKDESFNPTGSFKARGLCMAVSKAAELGITDYVIPTAGNAGGALVAYTALAQASAHIFMPKDAPKPNQIEAQILGADLTLVDGLITDAAKQAKAAAAKHGWFDVSTFKEPFRAEGKKTMGLELALDFDWQLPDVIIYPTGGGTGLVGMWKAFKELEALGWIGKQRPRMVVVQADQCAPVVRAFQTNAERAQPWENAQTIASGLRVPVAFADRLILEAVRDSQGTAISVTDEEMIKAQALLAKKEGIFSAPEGAATFAAYQQLINQKWIHPDEKVVLFNTATGLKYI
ncbi:MAG: threonine synthase [Anaerolineaceae bacterium]|nr:threonine synthase [Anaerolineaceae bacterium]